MAGVRTRALTASRPIKPTSPRCHSAWQPDPGRGSTYRCGKSVQTTGTTSNLSVCAQKVRIVLAEKGVPWTSRYVSLVRGEQLTPEFKKMNPRGLVPVLAHDGNTIVESSVICSYLDEVFQTRRSVQKIR